MKTWFKEYNLSLEVIKKVKEYSNNTHLKVVNAFVVEGSSHREIQREILNLPAPARGGGYVAMNILHYYGITGKAKKALSNNSLKEFLKDAPEQLVFLLTHKHHIINEVTNYGRIQLNSNNMFGATENLFIFLRKVSDKKVDLNKFSFSVDSKTGIIEWFSEFKNRKK